MDVCIGMWRGVGREDQDGTVWMAQLSLVVYGGQQGSGLCVGRRQWYTASLRLAATVFAATNWWDL